MAVFKKSLRGEQQELIARWPKSGKNRKPGADGEPRR
jgi:hypothetical protein